MSEVEQAEVNASAAWSRMMEARAAGNRRAENRAFREHEQHRDAARRARAFANQMVVSAHGFAE